MQGLKCSVGHFRGSGEVSGCREGLGLVVWWCLVSCCGCLCGSVVAFLGLGVLWSVCGCVTCCVALWLSLVLWVVSGVALGLCGCL